MTQYTRRGHNITRLGGTTKTRSATVHLLLKNSALATNVPYRGAHVPSSIRRNQCIDQKPNQPSRHTCHAEQTQYINHTHPLPHQTPVPNHNPKGGDCQVAPFYCLSQDGWLKLLDSAHVTSQPRKKTPPSNPPLCSPAARGGALRRLPMYTAFPAAATLHHRGTPLSGTQPGRDLHLNLTSLRVASLTAYCNSPRSGPKPHTLGST
jgi:hypothetical protein